MLLPGAPTLFESERTGSDPLPGFGEQGMSADEAPEPYAKAASHRLIITFVHS